MNEVPKTLYETDFRLWLAEQATLLRTRHVDKLDFENLAVELEAVFEQQENELKSAIKKLHCQMIKWMDESDRTPSAYSAIVEFRRLVDMRMDMSPSLFFRATHYFEEVGRDGMRLTRSDLMDYPLDHDIGK